MKTRPEFLVLAACLFGTFTVSLLAAVFRARKKERARSKFDATELAP